MAQEPPETGAGPEEQAPGQAQYANYFKVGYNDVEFLLDFGQQLSAGKVVIHTRIVTSPAYIREYVNLLSASADRFDRESEVG